MEPRPPTSPKRRPQLRRDPRVADASPHIATNPAAQAAGLPKPARGVRVVGSGVDTLHVFSRAPVDPGVSAELERAQAAALARGDSPDEGEPVEVAGQPFVVKPHRARTAPLLLDAPNVMAVLVNPAAAAPFPTVTVELRALFLWQEGADAAMAAVERVVRALVVPVDASADLVGETQGAAPRGLQLDVSRLDLAVDFQGWTPPPEEGFHDPTDESVTRYVTRAQDFAAHVVTSRTGPFRGRRFSGFMFGRGEVACRLYDKTLEAHRSGKASAMEKVWKAAPGYEAGAPVWRLEYQLRRGAISELRVAGATVSTWRDLRRILRGLWLHLSTRWLVRRAPRTRTSRQPLSPEWSAVSGAGFAGGPWAGTEADVLRAHREDLAARLTPQLTGYLVRALAEEIYFSPDREPGELPALSLDDAWPAIRDRVLEHAAQRGVELETRAEEKVGGWDNAALAVALADEADRANPFTEEAAA